MEPDTVNQGRTTGYERLWRAGCCSFIARSIPGVFVALDHDRSGCVRSNYRRE